MYVSKNVGIRGYFSKPKGVCEQNGYGKTGKSAIDNYMALHRKAFNTLNYIYIYIFVIYTFTYPYYNFVIFFHKLSIMLIHYTYLLTPWCRVFLEKLTGLQLVKKFPAFLWNPKVYYRTHKRPPPVPVLGQPNPVHIPTSHLLEIHPNIIHPSTPKSPQRSLSLRFPHQDTIRPLSSVFICISYLLMFYFRCLSFLWRVTLPPNKYWGSFCFPEFDCFHHMPIFTLLWLLKSLCDLTLTISSLFVHKFNLIYSWKFCCYYGDFIWKCL